MSRVNGRQHQGPDAHGTADTEQGRATHSVRPLIVEHGPTQKHRDTLENEWFLYVHVQPQAVVAVHTRALRGVGWSVLGGAVSGKGGHMLSMGT